jgi:uroporphyrin-III C-methyltransferase/precorrin-2 dehydrogenase/sirohydrochlorin ferrochelatase
MAVETLPEIAQALLSGGLAGQTPAVCIQDGGLAGQRVLTATLDSLAEVAAVQQLRPPAVVVIGAVAGLHAQAPVAAVDPVDTVAP